MPSKSNNAPSGVVVLDKPAGMTSHDVVARLRRIIGTRRVGHAGTLDPSATGVLVCGVGKATKLLGYLSADRKSYDAVMRLGASTLTDDAEGEVTSRAEPQHLAVLTDGDVHAAVQKYRGEIQQVPSAVSAVKIRGERAYARVRAGESVELPARSVQIYLYEVGPLSVPTDDAHARDLTAHVVCSSGTYIRALARDLGTDLGVGGHLRSLRRTRAGVFSLKDCVSLEELEQCENPVPLSLSDAARSHFPVRTLTEEESGIVLHGGWIESGEHQGVYAAQNSEGRVIALLRRDGARAQPVTVFGSL